MSLPPNPPPIPPSALDRAVEDLHHEAWRKKNRWLSLAGGAILTIVVIGFVLSRREPSTSQTLTGATETLRTDRYIAAVLKRLEDGVAPQVILANPDPILLVETMRTGDVGLLGAQIDIVQVQGESDYLAKAQGAVLWFTGVDTTDIADGQRLNASRLVCEVLGTKRYATALGPATVRVVRPFDASRAREAALQQLAAALQKRKVWRPIRVITGHTTQDSPAFSVDTLPWRLRWDSADTSPDRISSLIIAVSRGGNELLSFPCDGLAGEKSIDLPAGEYHLAISSSGRIYTITAESHVLPDAP